MGKIALAGATSSIGLAIRQQLDAHCGHDYIVLVRQHKEDDSRAVTVDYTSTEALKETLRAHSIDTVISAISIANEPSGIAQLNLIEAATQATCVKRFLPSEYGANYTEDNILHTPSYAYKLKARELLAQSNLKYSIVSIGIYLDYWGCPYIPSILDSQKRAAVFIDLAHNFAAIPGDGSIPVAFTHSKDAARFIQAMLDLPSWPKDCFFAGDRLTLSEFLSLAEDAKGTKFDVHYDTQEKLEAGEVTVNPGVAEKFPLEHAKSFMKELSLSYLKGGLDLPPSKCRNDILSDGKWLRVQDVLDAWRAG